MANTLANTLEEAQKIADIADEYSLPIAVSQNYRWQGPAFVVRHLIEAGFVGEVHLASIEIYGTQDRDLKEHDFYAGCDDFLTVQWNTHLADLLQYWTASASERASQPGYDERCFVRFAKCARRRPVVIKMGKKKSDSQQSESLF